MDKKGKLIVVEGACDGIGKSTQYQLLKEIDDTALLQGFYFYRPLEKQGLIDAIRGANKVSKSKD